MLYLIEDTSVLVDKDLKNDLNLNYNFKLQKKNVMFSKSNRFIIGLIFLTFDWIRQMKMINQSNVGKINAVTLSNNRLNVRKTNPVPFENATKLMKLILQCMMDLKICNVI